MSGRTTRMFAGLFLGFVIAFLFLMVWSGVLRSISFFWQLNGWSFPWLAYAGQGWILWSFLPIMFIVSIIIWVLSETIEEASEKRLNVLRILAQGSSGKPVIPSGEFSAEVAMSGLARKARRIKKLTKESARAYRIYQDKDHRRFIVAEQEVKAAIDDFWSCVDAIQKLLISKVDRPNSWKVALKW